MMRVGDTLLSFLNAKERGSWTLFCRAVDEVAGASASPYGLALALAARALVEFNWLSNRRWTALPTGLVRLSGEANRYLLVGLLEADMTAKLLSVGLELHSEEEPLVPGISFTRTELTDQNGFLDSHDGIPISNDDRYSYVAEHLRAGEDLLYSLPQLGSAIASREPSGLEVLVGGLVEVFDRHQLDFVKESSHLRGDGTEPEVVRLTNEYGARSYYYIEARSARRIEREIGITYSVRSLPYALRDQDTLLVDRRVPLPPLIERALFLDGARLSKDAHIFRSRPYRVYRGVESRKFNRLAFALMTTITRIEDLGELK